MSDTTPVTSPAKRRFDASKDGISCPTSKRRKTALPVSQPLPPTDASTASPDVMAPVLFAFASPDDDNVVPLGMNQKTDISTTLLTPTRNITTSHEAMDAETHNERMAIRDGMKSGKGTETAYPRHVKNYVDFMITDQTARQQDDPNWVVVPPFPITARNVAMFLKFETTRSKKTTDGHSLPGTRLGVESIKQCISALENWRLYHQHMYKDDPEALRPLRNDERIKTFEVNARSSERDKNSDEQTSKAKGATSGKFYSIH